MVSGRRKRKSASSQGDLFRHRSAQELLTVMERSADDAGAALDYLIEELGHSKQGGWSRYWMRPDVNCRRTFQLLREMCADR